MCLSCASRRGTSLSKVFGLIHRFSEDIDISLSREALGFAGDRDLANPALSGNQRRRLDEELGTAIEKTISTSIHRSLLFLARHFSWVVIQPMIMPVQRRF
jgi:predicted nucleotidyltransferase component of viral defense system